MSRLNSMSTDSSGGPVPAQATDEFIPGTRYSRVMSDGSYSRGSVIILKFFCHSVILFDSNLCFLFHSLMSLYMLVGTIHSLDIGAHGFGPRETSVKGKEEAGMFSYSQRDMTNMAQVRNLLSLFDRTPPARVVKGLCDRDTYFCSPRFDAILNRSPCSPWEQHHVVSPVAQAPAWTLPERVVIRPYGSGNCGCRRNPPGRVVSCPWISDFCGRSVIPAGFAKPLGMHARLATSSATDQSNIHFIQPVQRTGSSLIRMALVHVPMHQLIIILTA